MADTLCHAGGREETVSAIELGVACASVQSVGQLELFIPSQALCGWVHWGLTAFLARAKKAPSLE